MNQLSIYSAILIILGGECFHGINGEEFSIETTNFTGKWYAVMSTGCADGKECNIFTNNEIPCQCISAFFRPLQEIGWQVYMSAINNDTSTVTVDMGGAALSSSDSEKGLLGFIISRATMPMSVLSKSECEIGETVKGKQLFLRYKITILGSSVQYNYMITTMTEIDESNNNKGNPLTVIWCRNRTPGKDTIWTQIVKHMSNLKSDIHLLKFINQLNCKYPSENQYNEMYFC